ncbi:epoxyqueuosine reductase [Methanocella sp. CWC-04]|uniref:Epoxyqueuosine reductase n=1 Tax=Methanooceanicella nereidis TaxID=2052831 RepID=A0AAP2W6F1_9EURY|nr:4Fe-4S dicluster domain-containing protein [Methanocella sp. CWC-04]MCD1294209.1 epoxyqueuosine reductase [Methanocella sp. CWC-04]
MGIIEGAKSRYVAYRLNRIKNMELSLNKGKGRIPAAATSPDRLLPNRLEITLKTLPKQLSIAKGMELASLSIHKNPDTPKEEADESFLSGFEEYAHMLGIAKIGYTEVPPEYIFKDRSIAYTHAIVLIYEMDKRAIDSAPGPETQAMGITTYDELGQKTNELTDYLRKNGFAAEAGHPAGGPVMHPRLAHKAGLGHHGRNGLLITPEFGPRQRISAIFTSIKNLPVTDNDMHSWVPGFCASCGNCIRVCAGNALYCSPVTHADGRLTFMDSVKCTGCTLCMKECSFNKGKYEGIKKAYMKKAERKIAPTIMSQR